MDNKNSLAVSGSNTSPDMFVKLRQVISGPLFWLMLICGYVLYSRLWNLAGKVMHHDESLFAYYGYWLYRGNGYDYQPILHGPVLQFVSAFFFLLFGDDQWTMRLPSLLGGLLMFPVVWKWRRYLGGNAGVIAATALIALSPSIAYYTRFLRNDVPYLTATMCCGYCLNRAFQTASAKYIWGSILTATLMFCMMESSIFFFAACIGYLVTMSLVDQLIWRRPIRQDAAREADRRPGKLTLRDLFLTLFVALGITVAAGWLFYRVFYATLHIYKPVVAGFALLGLTISPRTANLIIAYLAVMVVYGLSLLILSDFCKPRGRYKIVSRFTGLFWQKRWHVLAGVSMAVIIYTTLFTTFFTFRSTASFDHQVRDFAGPVKALTPVQIYQNTWDYWWDQHKLHRIKGPFHYYLPILFLYELPILVLAALGWCRALRRTVDPWFHVMVLASMHLFLAAILWALPPINWEWMDQKFHLTHETHLFLILLYAQLLVYITPILYNQGRRAESFITYWAVTSLFAYSYAGEKVPWLTVHSTGPLALLAAAELGRLWQYQFVQNIVDQEHSLQSGRWRRIALMFICLAAVVYQVRNNHLLLIKHPWSPAERLVYNHTSPDIEKAVRIADEIGQKTNFGTRLPIYMQGEMGWPLHWYLRDYSNIIAPVGETADNTSRPLVMVDWQAASSPNLQQNYYIQRMKVREWWEPEMLSFSKLSDIFLVFTPGESRNTGPMAQKYTDTLNEWKRLWHYLAYREIWIDDKNPGWSNGTNEFALCIRKDIQDQLMTYQWLSITPKRTDVPVFQPY